MRLLSFQCDDIHGCITRKVAFDPSVSLLVGINGSGKTTVIRAIFSLLSPDISWLLFTDYKAIHVEVLQDDEVIKIRAEKSGDVWTLTYTAGHPTTNVVYSDNLSDLQAILRMNPDERSEVQGLSIVRERMHNKTPLLLQLMEALPSPVFLSLDRTNLGRSHNERIRSRPSVMLRSRMLESRTSLSSSLEAASAMYSEAKNRFRILRERLAVELRDKLLTAPFVVESEKSTLEAPNKKVLTSIKQLKNKVLDAYKVIGMASDNSSTVEAFFEEGLANALPISEERDPFKILRKTNTDNEADSKKLKAVYQWFDFYSRLSVARRMEPEISSFSEQVSKLEAKLKSFEQTVNSFFEDSGKSLSVNQGSALGIILKDGKSAELDSLSSGERQILVLVANLMFGEASEKSSSVVIVDEPELSLHIAWQEKFVAGLLEANKDAQLILATHSPSIIGPRADKCFQI